MRGRKWNHGVYSLWVALFLKLSIFYETWVGYQICTIFYETWVGYQIYTIFYETWVGYQIYTIFSFAKSIDFLFIIYLLR